MDMMESRGIYVVRRDAGKPHQAFFAIGPKFEIEKIHIERRRGRLEENRYMYVVYMGVSKTFDYLVSP